jgi:hypothetical protein
MIVHSHLIPYSSRCILYQSRLRIVGIECSGEKKDDRNLYLDISAIARCISGCITARFAVTCSAQSVKILFQRYDKPEAKRF